MQLDYVFAKPFWVAFHFFITFVSCRHSRSSDDTFTFRFPLSQCEGESHVEKLIFNGIMCTTIVGQILYDLFALGQHL